ncbi:MAG: MATE family efflux transporter [Saprospiraceae bacterium]|nr:MATE family efflux transporter [Saprospiraceae bacterium]
MRKLIDLIRESFLSEDADFTAMSINKAIFMLSLPMVIEMFFEALFALADAFFVARYVGVNGVATVGLTESVMTIVYSLAWGLSSAATAIVARRTGEKNIDAASHATGQVILVSLAIGIILGLPAFFGAQYILGWMGGDEELIASGSWYAKLQFLSSPIAILLFSLSGALRGAGKAITAMKAVIIANIINIALDFTFVALWHWGVEGAAMATIIGRTFGVLYQLYYLLGFKDLGNKLASLMPDKQVILSIIKIASGSAGQFLIQSASWIFLVTILAFYGSEVIAGYTIAIRVIIFAILPSWGLANAGATLLGQNMGANQIQKGISTVWKIAIINAAFMGFIAILFYAFSTQIIVLFESKPYVVAVGKGCLEIMSMGYIFFGIGMVIVQAINGAGDTAVPTIFNLICYWLIQIPLSYFMAKNLGMDYKGVFYSIIISETIWTILGAWYFRTGRWQKTQV